VHPIGRQWTIFRNFSAPGWLRLSKDI
jgi:hypothetical protein